MRFPAATGTITAALAVLSIFAGAALQCARSLSRPQQDVDDDEECEQLLAVETRFLAMGMPPTTTLTWFDGDHKIAAAFLAERVREVVSANAWLGGRVKRRHGVTSVSLRTMDPQTFQHARPNPSFSRSATMSQIKASCSQFLVKNGPWEPVFKVTVIPCAEEPNKRFGVLVSLSHIVGDGHTFYSIYNMLSVTKTVGTLTARRSEDAYNVQNKMLAEPNLAIGWIAMHLAGTLWRRFFAPVFGPKVVWQYGLVDMAWVSQAKAAAKGDSDATFVSTNDVLTSWFFRTTMCDVGFMAYNFRHRIPIIGDEHAGNYQRVVFYRQPDWETPGLIRHSLSAARRAVTGGQPMSVPALLVSSGGTISNWSTFASDLELPQCTEDLHTPVYDIGKWYPANMCNCVVFRARRDQLAVMMMGSPSRMAGTMHGGPVVESAFLREN